MPQMSPYNWLLMFFYFNMILIFYINFLNYNNLPKLNINFNNMNNFKNKINLKW